MLFLDQQFFNVHHISFLQSMLIIVSIFVCIIIYLHIKSKSQTYAETTLWLNDTEKWLNTLRHITTNSPLFLSQKEKIETIENALKFLDSVRKYRHPKDLHLLLEYVALIKGSIALNELGKRTSTTNKETEQ